MGKLIMLTGGARCGKSVLAQEIAQEFGDSILYIATLVPNDEDMRYRVEKRKQLRPETWDTLEAYKGIDNYIDDFGAGYDAIILDCVSVMVENLMMEYTISWQGIGHENVSKIEKEIRRYMKQLVESAKIVPAPIIMVTNEIGMGTTPTDRFSSIFRDIVGKVNSSVAEYADEVYLVISGLKMRIK